MLRVVAVLIQNLVDYCFHGFQIKSGMTNIVILNHVMLRVVAVSIQDPWTLSQTQNDDKRD
jgi:hypothetical protein